MLEFYIHSNGSTSNSCYLLVFHFISEQMSNSNLSGDKSLILMSKTSLHINGPVLSFHTFTKCNCLHNVTHSTSSNETFSERYRITHELVQHRSQKEGDGFDFCIVDKRDHTSTNSTCTLGYK